MVITAAVAGTTLATAPSPWDIVLPAAIAVAFLTGFWLIDHQWPSSEAKLEAAIAAFGVGIALGLLGVQLGLDQQRSDEARTLQEQLAKDAAATDEANRAADEARLEQDQSDASRRAIEQNLSQSPSLDATSFDDDDMTGLSIVGRSAREVSFVRSNLDDFRATRGDLTSADLSEAQGSGTSFESASLRRANLTAASFETASFVDADLAGAVAVDWTCRECDFSGASLAGVDLAGADLTGSIGSSDTWWPVHLSPATFGLLLPAHDARALVLAGRDLTGLDLTQTNLSDTDLQGSDLTAARLVSVNLAGADLRGATLDDVTFENVIIDNETDLDTPIPGAVNIDDLDGDLPPGTWRMDSLTVENLSLTPDTGYRLIAPGAVFIDGSFSGADVGRSDFRRATLDRVAMRDTKVGGTTFQDADLRTVPVDDLRSTRVVDPVNGGIPFINNDTQLPAGFAPPIEWFNTSEPVSYDIKLNWIVSGLNLGQTDRTNFATSSDYQIFQSRGADLRNLSFASANLLLGEFVGSDLRGTLFRSSNLVGADFSYSALDPLPTTPNRSCGSGSSQFCGAVYDNSTIWPDTYVVPTDAINLDADLTGQNLSGAWLGNNSFRTGTRAVAATFNQAFMESSDWSGSVLKGSSFTAIQGSSLRMNAASLVGTTFDCATLTGAEFRGADLTGATFDGADLTNADLTGAQLDPGALANATTTGATLPADYRSSPSRTSEAICPSE